MVNCPIITIGDASVKRMRQGDCAGIDAVGARGAVKSRIFITPTTARQMIVDLSNFVAQSDENVEIATGNKRPR